MCLRFAEIVSRLIVPTKNSIAPVFIVIISATAQSHATFIDHFIMCPCFCSTTDGTEGGQEVGAKTAELEEEACFSNSDCLGHEVRQLHVPFDQAGFTYWFLIAQT